MIKFQTAQGVLDAFMNDVKGAPFIITAVQWNKGNNTIAVSYTATDGSKGAILLHFEQLYELMSALYRVGVEAGVIAQDETFPLPSIDHSKLH